MTLTEELQSFLTAPFLLSCDTRTLKKGDVFVTIPCDQALANGKKALKKGAKAIVCEADVAVLLKQENNDCPVVVVSNARLAFSQLAHNLYPGQPQTMMAVTGTNGKSSVVNFVRQLWIFYP